MADPASYRPRTSDIPTSPGVYRFFDSFGNVIYVGKAKNLRNRLSSYFVDLENKHFRTQTMVRTAARVDWTVVGSEVEALQLEYTWIQQFDPRFNVKYRDDKSYPWLAVTWSEEFPRVMVGRGAKKRGTRYFGPYGQAWAIRDTLDLLLRVFPMRSCSKGVFDGARRSGRACLLGDIGKCSAPCIGRVSAEEHREIAGELMAFMGGRTGDVIGRVERAMYDASADLNFERAATLRDALDAMKKVQEKQAVVFNDGKRADVVGFAEDPTQVAVQVFHVVGGKILGERGWVADRSDDRPITELVEAFIAQLYAADDADIPPTVYTSVEAEPAVAELLTARRGATVEVRVPLRGEKRRLLDTVVKNAELALEQYKRKRSTDLTTRNRALEEIEEALGLPAPPLRIECYDISHTMGQEVVGSMVVFEDGLARNSEYRRFLIKGFEGSDDVRAIREVLTRRLRRLKDNEADDLVDATTGVAKRFAYAPSLIIVDGGAPQVAAAAKVLEEFGLSDDIALCGLAKRLEEVWLPGEEYPLILPRTSDGLYLMQRARDEAHRFAITFHRQRRGKALIDSILDGVPGLGDVRRKALMKYFGSVKKLRAATVQEIDEVPGIGPGLAKAIYDVVQASGGEAINLTTGEVTET
ncbi:excinuclease ABC subunit UvrC [uncultured Tessaracoccus sp.]|uniref:excinuclease ABC subunit UvrC n=1 Tax=uncultured Tessaracoccus sp. TaxID=905023 RepID=UPI00262F6444|nr:excinuclease ABC subunit UvrC [uncultured Tessaracoccus sp.]